MTGPNLDKDIEHILVNVALNGAYEDAGQRVLSQGTIVKAKKYIDLLIANQVREARIDGIREYADALIDLFVNPPAELGAAEDMHLHPWQIKNMILESLNHLDELKGDNK